MTFVELQRPAKCSALILLMLLVLNTASFADYGEFGGRVSGGIGFGNQVDLDSIKLGLGFDDIVGLDATLGSSLLLIQYGYWHAGVSLDLYPLKVLVIQNRVQSFFVRDNYLYTAYGVAFGVRGLKFSKGILQFVAGYSLFRTHQKIDDPFGFFFELTVTEFYPFASN